MACSTDLTHKIDRENAVFWMSGAMDKSRAHLVHVRSHPSYPMGPPPALASHWNLALPPADMDPNTLIQRFFNWVSGHNL